MDDGYFQEILMRRLKTIISIAGILLLILSAASMYVALKALSELRPAEDYEDQGVLTFRPYDVLPVQVQNTGASSRDRRMNPTKTVSWSTTWQQTAAATNGAMRRLPKI